MKDTYKRDVDEICKLVEDAHNRGATDEQCDEIADWLEEVMPAYTKKMGIKVVAMKKTEAKAKLGFMLKLDKRSLRVALKRKIAQVCDDRLLEEAVI